MRKQLMIGVVLGMLWGIMGCGPSGDKASPDAQKKADVAKQIDVKVGDALKDTAVGGSVAPSAAPEAAPAKNAEKPLAPQDASSPWLNPLVNEVTASSFFLNHPPGHILDGINDTAWNARGDAFGAEWIEFKFEAPMPIARIVMTTGWEKMSKKYESLFYGNSRARKVKLLLDGKEVAVQKAGAHTRRLVFDNVNASATAVRLVFQETFSGAQWRQLAISDVDIWRNDPPEVKRHLPCAIPEAVSGVYTAHDVRDQDILMALFPAYDRISGRVTGAQICHGERVANFSGIEPAESEDVADAGWDAKNYPVMGWRQNLDDGRLMAFVVTAQEASDEYGVLVLAAVKDGVLSILPGPHREAVTDKIRAATHHTLAGQDVWVVPYGTENTGGGSDLSGDNVWLQTVDRLVLAGTYHTGGYTGGPEGENAVEQYTATTKWRPNELLVTDNVILKCYDQSDTIIATHEYTRVTTFALRGTKLVATGTDNSKAMRCAAQ